MNTTESLAQSLGVSATSLQALGATRKDVAWTFPERDAEGQIIGTARRLDDGRKLMVTGSKRGLTMAWPLDSFAGSSVDEPILIVEGASDTAAGMDLGFVTIGRPSATGGLQYLRRLLRDRHVALVGENDGVGRQGAEQIASGLVESAASVRILYPPACAKDLREWYTAPVGCNREELLSLIRRCEPIEVDRAEAIKLAEPGATGSPCPEVRPLPNDLPPVMPYESDLLPNLLRSFVDDIAERLQCPPDFPATATLAVVGSVIGRRCGIRPRRRDDWLVVPNLWGGVVGRPSLLKTPAIKSPLSLLQRLEAKARRQFEDDQREYEKQAMLTKAKRQEVEKKLRSTVARGGDTSTVLAMLDDCDSDAPVRERFITNDATVEKLGEILADNPAGVMVFRDELTGWLYNLEKENQQGARAFHLEAWDGTGRFTYDRIGRGTVDIESAIVSVFGGIQPGRLAPYVRSAVEGGIDDDGLIQRFQLLVWPDVPKQWRNVDRWPDTEARQQVFGIIERLHDITIDSLGAETDKYEDLPIPYLRFDKPAQKAFDVWREQLELRLRSGEEHPAVEAHLGKYRSLIPSLALILHLVEHDRGPVLYQAVVSAIRWGEYLESHARRIYSAAISAEVVAAKAIWKRICRGDLPDGFNARVIYRRGWTGLTESEAVKAALELLVEHGHIIEQAAAKHPGNRGRTPDPRYITNPVARAETGRTPTDKADKTDSVSSVSTPTGHSDDESTEECPPRLPKLVKSAEAVVAPVGGVTVEKVRTFKSAARDGAARLIRDARRGGDDGRAVALRDAWRERLAICTVDGDLSIRDAEAVALDELRTIVA